MTVLAGIVLASCSKMDGTYKDFIKDGEIRYSQRPDTLGVRPGHHRVEAWIAAKRSNLSKFKVFWNDRLDSVVVPVTGTTGDDTLRVVIDGLAEGSYIFEFFTYDREGNTSLPVDTVGNVYGDDYIASLSNRLTKRGVLINGNAKVEWYDVVDETIVGTEMVYKDQTGAEHTIFVKPEDDVTRIAERPLDDEVRYRTVFKPHPKAIDVFYSSYKMITLEVAEAVELDKGKFKEVKLPSDAPLSRYAKGGMADLWDGTATNTTFYGTEAGSGSPHWFTFDMGVTVGLSKLVYHQRAPDNVSLLFTNANARKWEVWGSNDPNPDGSWDDTWIKLMDCVSTRPSGKPYTQAVVQGDIDFIQARDGETFMFPENIPPVRYIRIKVLDTWNPSANDRSFMAELTLFGVAE